MDISDETRSLVRDKALSLEYVTPRRMFGSDAYLVNGKMFVCLGDMGLLVKPPAQKREELLKLSNASPFQIRPGKPFGDWVALKLASKNDRVTALFALEDSYWYVRGLQVAQKHTER